MRFVASEVDILVERIDGAIVEIHPALLHAHDEAAAADKDGRKPAMRSAEIDLEPELIVRKSGDVGAGSLRVQSRKRANQKEEAEKSFGEPAAGAERSVGHVVPLSEG